jgi:hypothetical protein
VASSLAGDRVKLLFSHYGGWSGEIYIGTKENLVSNL